MTQGYLVVWETIDGRLRDVFFQGIEYANRTADKCITAGYRVWIESVNVSNETGMIVR